MPLEHELPDAAFEADVAALGQKGAGKTYAMKGRVERLLDMGRRVVIIDPLGSWWGLKGRPDGTPGFSIAVIGGEHGDIPLNHDRGEELGAFLAAGNMSVVIDVSELSRGKMIRFAEKLLGALYHHTREALWLVLEEADVFAPQQPMNDQTMMLHQVDQIARRGRARGLRLWTITQRPAKLHKDVLTQISTLIALRLRAPQDRAAVQAWVEGNADRDKAKEIIGQLASLQTGEGWVWAPDFDILSKVRFPTIQTLDTSSTPKAGEKAPGPVTLAKADVSALQDLLKASVEEKVTAAGAPDPKALRAEYDRGYTDGYCEGSRATFFNVKDSIDVALIKLTPEGGRDPGGQWPCVTAAEERAKAATSHDLAKAIEQNTTPPPRPPDIGTAGVKPHQQAGALSPACRRSVAVLEQAFPRALSYRAAAKRAGVSVKSSAFNSYRKQIVDAGAAIVIEGDDKLVAAHGAPVQTDGVDPIAAFCARLPPSYGRMLRAIAASADPISREAIAEAAQISPTSSGLGAGIKDLLELDLIERTLTGAYRLSKDLR